MLKEVFKKGGKRETFSESKIAKALFSAAKEANLSKEKEEEMVDKVLSELREFLKDKKEISTVEIEAKILLELDKIAPEAVKVWRDYRRKKE